MRDHLDDETLDDLLAGRLKDEPRAAALAHIRQCEACRREMESTERLLALAESLPRNDAVDFAHGAALRQRLEPGARWPHRLRRQGALVAATLLLAAGLAAGAGTAMVTRQYWAPTPASPPGEPLPMTTTFEEERERALLRQLSGRGRFIRQAYDSLRVIDRQLDSLEFLEPASDSAARLQTRRLVEARHFYWREILRMIGEQID